MLRGSDSATQQRRILVLAQLPPPIHGVTVTTARVLDALSQMPDVVATHAWSGSARTLAELDGKSLQKLLEFAGLNLRVASMALLDRRRDVAYLTLAPLAHTALRDGLIAWWGKRLADRALVHLHGEGLEQLIRDRSFKSRLMRFLLRGTELLAITSSATDAANRSGIFKKVEQLPNCAPDPGPPRPRTSGKLRIGFLGNLDPRKGVIEFLDVIERLAAENWPIEAVIAGSSTRIMTSADLESEIRRRGLAGRIEIFTALHGEEKDRFFASLDVFLYLSAHDHAPLVIIEALSHGVVPIASDMGGIPEILGGGLARNIVSLRLAKAERIEAVTRLLRGYRAEPQRLIEDSEIARQIYVSQFTEMRFVKRLNAIMTASSKASESGPTEKVRLALPSAIKSKATTSIRRLHKKFAQTPLPDRIALYFHALEGDGRSSLVEAVAVLRERGYRYAALDAYLDPAAPGKLFTVSIDDNYASWYESLPLLAELDIKATFFTNSRPFRDACSKSDIDAYFARIGVYEAGVPLSRAELRALSDAGHDIGCHTHSHFLLARVPRDDWEREIRASRLRLEDIAGRAVRHFSWPYGMPRHITAEQKDYCLASGFVSISAATPAALHGGIADRRNLPRSEWRANHTVEDNLADLAIDGRLFTRLTGRSAIG